MLNISSIKELFHKPSEIQWNITGTLPGKLKRKISWALILQHITPWNHKNMRNCYFFLGGGYFVDVGTNVEFNDFVWFCEFLKVSGSIFWLKTVSSLYLLVKNSFNFKLGFLLILNLIQGALAEKKFLTDYHSTRWYWCKNPRKTFHKLHIKFFLNA